MRQPSEERNTRRDNRQSPWNTRDGRYSRGQMGREQSQSYRGPERYRSMDYSPGQFGELSENDYEKQTYFGRNDWSTGPHVGKGPKGYTRADDRIKDDVCEVLSQHGEIDASDISVDVENGEVSLTGTVEDRRIKRLAEQAIEYLPGVRDVSNRLRVAHPTDQETEGKLQGQQTKGKAA